MGTDVDSKVVILTTNVEVEPSTNMETELPAASLNVEFQETMQVNEQATGSTGLITHDPV